MPKSCLSFSCLRGGGVGTENSETLPLPLGQARLSLPCGVQLLRAAPDGLCFFHSIRAMVNDQTSWNTWTMKFLCDKAGHNGSDWAERTHIHNLSMALALRVVIFRVDLADPTLTVNWAGFETYGPEHGSFAPLLWWTRHGHGVHFDALSVDDDISHLNYVQVRRHVQALGHNLGHHEKAFSARTRLRRLLGLDPFVGLLDGTLLIPALVNPLPLPSLDAPPSQRSAHSDEVTPLSPSVPQPPTSERSRSRLSVLSWNVQGLRSKLAELDQLVRTCSPDVLCLQETFLRPGQPFRLSGYVVAAREDRSGARGQKGGGILILVRHSLSHRQIVVDSRDDAQAVAVELGSALGVFTVGTLYWPPGTHDDFGFLRAQLDSLHSLCQLVVGDPNAPHAAQDSWASETSRGTFVADFLCSGSLVLIPPSEPTRVTTSSSSAPDICWLAPQWLSCHACVVHHGWTSDHLPLEHSLTSSSAPPRSHQHQRAKWCLTKANWPSYQKACDEWLLHNFESVLAAPSLDAAVACFNRGLLGAAAVSIPRGRGRKVSHAWWTPELSTLHRRRQELSRQLLKSDLSPSLRDRCRLELQTSRLDFQNAVRLAKQEHWKKFCASLLPSRLASCSNSGDQVLHARSSMSSFDVLRSLDGSKSTGSVPISGRHDPRGKATALVVEFAGRCQPVSPKQDSRCKREFYKSLPATSSPTLVLTPQMVKRAAKGLATGKAWGPDDIPAEFLQKLPWRGFCLLTELFNWSLRVAELPRLWKSSVLIPLCKPKRPGTDPSDYRGISLLCSSLKCLERLVHRELLKLVPLHHDRQFGFRAGRSVEQLLSCMFSRVSHILGDQLADGSQSYRRSRAGILSIDFLQAFDRVPLGGLLCRLQTLGLPSRLLRWFHSYLFGRRATVRVQGFYSRTRCLRAGVPQGSILGPRLWCYWLDTLLASLCEPCLACEPFAFADDLAILSGSPDVPSLEANMGRALDVVLAWSAKNSQPISLSKCQSLLLTRRSTEFHTSLVVAPTHPSTATTLVLHRSVAKDHFPALSVHGQSLVYDPSLALGEPLSLRPLLLQLPLGVATTNWRTHVQKNRSVTYLAQPIVTPVHTMKLLGVHVDCMLTFGPHVDHLLNVLHSRLQLLSRLSAASWGPSLRTLQLTCRVFVLSAATHALAAWWPYLSSAQQRRLDSCWYRLGRAVTGMVAGSPRSIVYSESSLPTFLDLARRASLRLLLQTMAMEAPPCLELLGSAPPLKLSARGNLGWKSLALSVFLPHSLSSTQLACLQVPNSPRPPCHKFCLVHEALGVDRPACSLDLFRQSYRWVNDHVLLAAELWTDGSLSRPPGSLRATSSAAAFILLPGPTASFDPIEGSKSCSDLATSFWNELHAVFLGLLAYPDADACVGDLLIVTDSASVIDVLASDRSLDYPHVVALVSRCLQLPCPRVWLLHAPSHSGLPLNERADFLARSCAQQTPPLFDAPFPCSLLRHPVPSATVEVTDDADEISLSYIYPWGLPHCTQSGHLYARWARFAAPVSSLNLPAWMGRILSQLRANFSPVFTCMASPNLYSDVTHAPPVLCTCGSPDSLTHLLSCSLSRPFLHVTIGLDFDIDCTCLPFIRPYGLLALLLVTGRIGSSVGTCVTLQNGQHVAVRILKSLAPTTFKLPCVLAVLDTYLKSQRSMSHECVAVSPVMLRALASWSDQDAGFIQGYRKSGQ